MRDDPDERRDEEADQGAPDIAKFVTRAKERQADKVFETVF